MEDVTTARARYDQLVAEGQWRPDDYPPPPYFYPEGIETPSTLQNLTHRLVERGFAEDEIRKILGFNWMRVFRNIWGG